MASRVNRRPDRPRVAIISWAAQNNLAVAGERAQQMDRLAVVEGLDAAAQCLAVDGYADRSGRVAGHGRRSFGCMFAESPLTLRPVQTT